jgi:hypothetical protein
MLALFAPAIIRIVSSYRAGNNTVTEVKIKAAEAHLKTG